MTDETFNPAGSPTPAGNIPIAADVADDLIATEIAKQDAMWGEGNERADATGGQLLRAGLAQLLSLYNRTYGRQEDGALSPAEAYPKDWSGFRNYGSDIANLVVAAAFIRQEIKRKLRNGEDTTRTSRTQPYVPATGLPNTTI